MPFYRQRVQQSFYTTPTNFESFKSIHLFESYPPTQHKMRFLAILFPLAALAAPVRSLPISAPTQQVATLQNTYMGPSVSPEGEQDSIGMRIMAESTHDGYTEVVEVLAYFPVGERVYFRTSYDPRALSAEHIC